MTKGSSRVVMKKQYRTSEEDGWCLHPVVAAPCISVNYIHIAQPFSTFTSLRLFLKMAQNLDLRCVLVPAPWVLGPKHVSNPE